jgi:hypothetical protein
LSGELKVSLGIVSTSLQQQAQTETQYSKLRAVLRYIESNERIGTIDNPEDYFRGVSGVRWGHFGEKEELVLFTGKTDQTTFALGGSSANVLGAIGTATVGYVSTTPFILRALASELKLELVGPGEADTLRRFADRDPTKMVGSAVVHSAEFMRGPVQEVEFLAKRLLFEKESCSEPAALLGTPLYVALAG